MDIQYGIMTMNNIELIYTNGSSYTAGGGLEPPKIGDNNVTNRYKKLYGVCDWEHEKYIAWPSYIELQLGIETINEARSGGGGNRVVRMSYDFIKNNWYRKDRIVLILEIPSGLREDIFYYPLNQYLIVNHNDSNQTENVFSFYGTTQYFRESKKEIEIRKQKTNDINFYMNTFFDVHKSEVNLDNNVIGLYSFCKQHGIKILLIGVKDNPFIESEDKIIEYPFDYCNDKKLTVKDEIKYGRDNHPGYFGHQKYGSYIINQLIEKTFVNEKFRFDLPYETLEDIYPQPISLL